MVSQIKIEDINIEVFQKRIKNVTLRVYPLTGQVRISAPFSMSIHAIRIFAISKINWIRKQQAKFQTQEHETPPDFIDRESHYLWGKQYLLEMIEKNQAPSVTLKGSRMVLQVRPKSNSRKRRETVENWYREQLRAELPALLAKWEQRMQVSVEQVYVRRMKTRWGSCNPRKRTIRLNTALARKPRECLEYLVVHEMAHFLVPNHSSRFISLMDEFLPNWRIHRNQLNKLPVRDEKMRDTPVF
jgi:predicted metal-dependent hydrolase